jgi:hypothetical protein
MVGPGEASKRKIALLALLLHQMSRSPELTKLMVLLIVWGHVRSRPGYDILVDGPVPKVSQLANVPKGQGFQVRRPRERFL